MSSSRMQKIEQALTHPNPSSIREALEVLKHFEQMVGILYISVNIPNEANVANGLLTLTLLRTIIRSEAEEMNKEREARKWNDEQTL